LHHSTSDIYFYMLYYKRLIMTFISEGQICMSLFGSCVSDSDCCSTHCVSYNNGTNNICEPLPLNYPCVFHFQCGASYSCGVNKTCCGDFYAMCNEKGDCCNSDYICEPEFRQDRANRCLIPDTSAQHVHTSIFLLMFTVLITFVLNYWTF
jgi:hypothetical protein